MHALTMRVSSAPAAVLRELVSTALPTGNNRPTSTAMIVITTNNSIRVKPAPWFCFEGERSIAVAYERMTGLSNRVFVDS